MTDLDTVLGWVESLPMHERLDALDRAIRWLVALGPGPGIRVAMGLRIQWRILRGQWTDLCQGAR